MAIPKALDLDLVIGAARATNLPSLAALRRDQRQKLNIAAEASQLFG